ncbi:MAG: homoserine dehydrogenase [Candidatus Diapherotrites archaeon]|nr:homoserine dehydrogenase [Candidatus Diapherotrites archaeon]
MVVEVGVGLIGFGTIGSGVAEIISKNAGLIEKRTGVRIVLRAVCDRSAEKIKLPGIDKKIFTADYKKVIANKEVDVVVELIGGYEPARTIILEAIAAKKHIVTANKAVLAKFGYEIFERAQKNNVNVLFEAAVGGCIPVIKTIEESYSSDSIRAIYGILNGTTNYILTKMGEGMDYREALKGAQEFGFAEADPSFDVEGKDAAQKISILASLAFDARIEGEPLTRGITDITKKDIEYARELGYAIKLLAVAKREGGLIDLRVHPAMIPISHILADVGNEDNAVLLVGKNAGQIFLSGKGAGRLPTATVVVTDIVEMGSRGRITQRNFEKAKMKPLSQMRSRYFVRFGVVDKPGVLAMITKILGDAAISIAAFSQKEVNREVVPIVLLTHEAFEEQMMKAVSLCNKLDVVREEAVVIRIEDLAQPLLD